MNLKEKLELGVSPLYLMDGTAYIYRSFYAQRHLQRSDGFPTNALVLVTRILLKILREEKPEYFLFVMDGKGPNFRNSLYPQYKANREAMPQDLVSQIEPVCRMVDALGISREVSNGIEADDCIASLSSRFSREMPVIIISGDKDLKQCLAPNVFMWDPGAKEEKLLTLTEFVAESGVQPSQWPDVQALIGDSSDNIPGVPGIGPKTARDIFARYKSLEDIKANLEKLPPKIQAKLEPGLKDMFLWRELATLRLDACSDLELANLRLKNVNLEACDKLADEFELATVRKEIAALARHSAEDAIFLPVNGDTAPIGPEPQIKKAREANLLADLPACQNLDVAIIYAENSPARIAAGQIDKDKICEEEYIWRGTDEDLCSWLKNCRKIVVPDLKPLLVRSPAWRKLLFLASHPPYMDLGLAAYLWNPEEGDYSFARLEALLRKRSDCANAGSASLALCMAGVLKKRLADIDMTALYENVELPLIPVLAQMEITGIAINPASFRQFLKEVENESANLEKKVYEEAGLTFNIRSSAQLAEVLFDRLHLPSGRKTRGGQPSTSQLALEKLAADYPIVDNVLQYRKLEKMRSTYLEPLPRLIDIHNRLHTTFNQEATATGRLSSSNPNLQNIPVRGALGQRMRSCFVAAENKLLVAADYSQIELRLLAHFSRDETLLAAFHKGEDIHGRTAALVFDIPQEQVQPDQRRMAKTINFGLLYGMGAQKLSQELKISLAQAKEFIERYFARLSGVKNFYEDVLQSARKNGFVTTMAGRRRILPDIYSTNQQDAAQAQRQAINAVVQGSAADVIKLAMLAVNNDPFLLANDARLLLQVHDELLLEAPADIAAEAGRRVAELMANVKPGGISIEVPLSVDWGTGKNWGEAH